MSRSKRTESRPLLGALAHLVVGVGARLPLRAARALGVLLGHASRVLPNPYRSVTRKNLAWCFPDRSDAWRRRLERRSLLETGRTMAEIGALFRWPAERLLGLVESSDGEERLERALAGGRGGLLLLPHLGNWELFNPWLMRRHPFVALYRPSRILQVERTLVEARERTGCTMLPATPEGLRRLYRALTAGRLALILPDQEPVRRGGAFAPFFGVPALTMTLVGRLARKFGAPVLFAFAERNERGRFDLRFRDAPEGIDDPDPVAAAARLNLGVERCVRERPEQYAWSYKRFKTRPPEERRALATPGDPTLVTLYRRPRRGENPDLRLR